MRVPVQVTFKSVPPSSALQAKIRDEAQWLGRYFDRIVACRVTVSQPHRHHHAGRPYQVSIRLTVPGKALSLGRPHHQHPSHADPYVAVREAFHAARRELEDYARRMRGEVKHHGRSPRAPSAVTPPEPRPGRAGSPSRAGGRESRPLAVASVKPRRSRP